MAPLYSHPIPPHLPAILIPPVNGGAVPSSPQPWFQLQLPDSWTSTNIATKEMVPVAVAAAILGRNWQGQKVLFESDNTATVATIRLGSARDPSLRHLLRCLFLIAASWQFEYDASHTPGINNSTADALSRSREHLLPTLVPTANSFPHLSLFLCGNYYSALTPPGRQLPDAFVQELYGHGLAGNSVRTYNSASRRYLIFCQTTQLTPLPLSEHTLCLFVAHLIQQNLQPSSIRTYLSSLRHLQISAGLPNPFTPDASPWLTYILRGINRSAPSHPDKRLPNTPEILRLIWQRWSSPPISYETRLLWAACCSTNIVALADIQQASSISSRIHPNTPPPL